MDIVIICNHTDCVHNKKELFVNYGEQDICDYSHPVFYKRNLDRHCTSKCVKHTKRDKTKSDEQLCNCSDGGVWLDGAFDTHCDRCKKHLR